MLVTDDGYEVLTVSAGAPPPPPQLNDADSRRPAMESAASAPTRAGMPPRGTRAAVARRRSTRAARRCARPSSRVPIRPGCCASRRASSIARSPPSGTSFGAPPELALVAVGGYGRGQLFPHSDVDVLILLPAALDAAGTAFVERFVGMLWDIGLEAGHSVRTIAECEREMAGDITVRTSLLEHRLVAGLAAALPPLRARVRRGDGAAALLRGEGARAAAAAPQVPRHGVQPRAEPEGEPGRTARPADRSLDRPRRRPRPLVARPREGGPHHDAGSAHRLAPGALHRRAARAAPLSRRPARGPPRVRSAERAGARARPRRHARRSARASS